jgi:hypothetical protein
MEIHLTRGIWIPLSCQNPIIGSDPIRQSRVLHTPLPIKGLSCVKINVDGCQWILKALCYLLTVRFRLVLKRP